MAYWLNATPADPVAFAAQVTAGCEVYQHAPAIAEQGGHVISTDEKTGIQALERAAPTLPMQPGVVERPAYEYLRHGPQCLIANFDVATGEVVAPTVGPSRTEEDFAGHIAHTIATDPEASWLFIVAQLHMHKSEALVRGLGGYAASHVEGTRPAHTFRAILVSRPWVVVTVPALVLCARW